MTTTPTTALHALDEIVERYGRSALTDPMTLAGALRTATTPPAEAEIEALVDVAGGDAIPRLRTALAQDRTAADVLGEVRDDRARWALAAAGAALGLVPRGALPTWPDEGGRAADGGSLDGGPDEPTVVIGTGRDARTAVVAPLAMRSQYRRRRLWPAVLAVLVVLLAGAGVAVWSVRETAAAPVAAPTPVPATIAPTATVAAAPKNGDPASVIQDPALRALAAPFLTGPDAYCEAGTPGINQRESVTCLLDDRRIGMFTAMLNADVMDDLRQTFLSGAVAEEGSVVSLRWRYTDSGRIGIPAANPDRGEGTRVRYVDDQGDPRLYFDQEATAVNGFLALVEPSGDPTADLDELRAFWMDPRS
jgi:hypothetical protein